MRDVSPSKTCDQKRVVRTLSVLFHPVIPSPPWVKKYSRQHPVLWKQFFFLWRCDPTRVMASSFLMFLYHTQRRTTVGRTPLYEWSTCRRDLYLTTHNNHNRQTSMPPAGFEPTISVGERPQTYALDRAATGTGVWRIISIFIVPRHIGVASIEFCLTLKTLN